MSALDRIKEI